MKNSRKGLGHAARLGRKQTIIVLSLALLAILALTTNSSATGNFTPTITFETSTTRSTAHPDARITIDNSSSSEDLRDLTIDLPKGFLGSLNAAEQCTTVQVAAVNCPANTKIGDVTNYATVDNSDVVLSGEVFLTEAHNPADPAGLQIVVPAVIGGVDMGKVHVEARVQIRYGALPSGFPAGAPGRVEGVKTIVTDIPNEIEDEDNRTVEFTLKKLVVDLKSDQGPGYSKLLTNPTVCSTTQITAAATSYLNTAESMSQNYTTDQCASASYKNPQFDFSASNTTANTTFGFETEISFPEDQGATKQIDLALSTGMGIAYPSFGTADDQCPGSSGQSNSNFNSFDPSSCPDQAMVGSVEIETPLLPEPLQGELWAVSASPVPNIAIYIDETTGVNNPNGVRIGLLGKSSTPVVPPGCVADDSLYADCPAAISVQFNGLPEVPISSVKVVADGPSRTGTLATLSGELLNFASATSPTCQPNDDVVTSMVSHLGASVRANAVSEVTITGCNSRSITMSGAPYGGVTQSTSPTLPFTSTDPTTYCSIDAKVAANPLDPNYDDDFSDDQTCSTPSFTPAAPLAAGLHRLFVFGGTAALTGNEESWRTFVVEPATTPDTTAPTTSIDSGPTSGTTNDMTPSWTFSATEASYFQCSVDGGAFLPCDAATTTSSGSSFAITEALYAGTAHEFAVRSQDAAGNVGAAAEATFDVEVDFDPSLTTLLTTTQARAHPDLDLTIDSLSNEDIQSVRLALPDGFFGGLTGVQSLCPIATAAAGNCTSASQVGTVETEARVDDSLVRIDGQVYLTESAHFGEPAGLSIKVPAVIQEVDLGDIIVAGRLQVRGQADGIDSLVIDIPQSIVPDNPYGDTETFFDMRQIKLKLRTGAGATHPLLTNPSTCNGSAFIASFTGYGTTETADSNPFAATGCESLGFGPSLSLSVVDSTSGQPPVAGKDGKSISANLTATLTSNPGDAAIKDVSILLPRPMTINLLEIPIACTVPEYNDGAGQCPESSKVGSVSAISPLLPEALTGTVYLLRQSDPARAVPRLLIALRGRINIDIIADNRFENSTQIRTILTDLPDVPLSSFTLRVDRVLSTRPEACTVPAEEWDALGQMTATNAKTAPVRQTIALGCKSTYTYSYKKRAKKSSLSVNAIGGPVKMKKLTVGLPKSVVPIKKGLKKKLIVTADGKRVTSRCYKVSKRSITVSLCGKTASIVVISFRAGSLNAGKKAPAPKKLKKLSISGVDTTGKKITFIR